MSEGAQVRPKPRKRMARADRRAQLLRIAREMIAAEGVESLSMNALADCAEVAKPVVYSHFANSNQVIVALLDDYYETRREYVRERTESARTMDEYISALLDSSFEFERQTALPMQRIGNGYSSGPEVNAAFDRYNGHLRKYWQEVLEQQGVPAPAAEIAAFGLTVMVSDTTAQYAVRPRASKRARAALKTMILSTIAALTVRPTSERPHVHVVSYREPALAARGPERSPNGAGEA